jgi:putative endonuclease
MLNLFQHLKYMEAVVYILTNKINTVLYVGATIKGLKARVWEHKQKLVEGFTKRYNVDKLVYFEPCEDLEQALEREKQLKNWHRQWKVNLIEKSNPEWKDLYDELD